MCEFVFAPSQPTSGIEIDPEIATLFNGIKLRKTHKWATFKIENKIVIDELGDPCTTENNEEDKAAYAKMMDTLSNEPRYILYDFGVSLKDGKKFSKLAFIFW